jgi:hypothetical protein
MRSGILSMLSLSLLAYAQVRILLKLLAPITQTFLLFQQRPASSSPSVSLSTSFSQGVTLGT